MNYRNNILKGIYRDLNQGSPEAAAAKSLYDYVTAGTEKKRDALKSLQSPSLIERRRKIALKDSLFIFRRDTMPSLEVLAAISTVITNVEEAKVDIFKSTLKDMMCGGWHSAEEDQDALRKLYKSVRAQVVSTLTEEIKEEEGHFDFIVNREG